MRAKLFSDTHLKAPNQDCWNVWLWLCCGIPRIHLHSITTQCVSVLPEHAGTPAAILFITQGGRVDEVDASVVQTARALTEFFHFLFIN